MNGQILFCGDTHSKHQHIIDAVHRHDPIAVVLLGDMEPISPLHEELRALHNKVWFIHGNHDTDSVQTFEYVWGSDFADRNIDGRVVTLQDGNLLGGLGGVFRQSV